MADSPLSQLADRLETNGISVDAVRIATVMLGIARMNDWTEHPERMGEWIEQLALDVVNVSATS
jgi:hypothetical protein